MKIKQSSIPALGKGLFAYDATKNANDIIFKKGEQIINYLGHHIDIDELNRRYDHYTAPYAIQLKRNDYIDAADKRGIGSLINHTNNKNKSNAEFISVYNTRPQEIKIRATKNITNNEEIFVNYGAEYRFDEPTDHKTIYRSKLNFI